MEFTFSVKDINGTALNPGDTFILVVKGDLNTKYDTFGNPADFDHAPGTVPGAVHPWRYKFNIEIISSPTVPKLLNLNGDGWSQFTGHEDDPFLSGMAVEGLSSGFMWDTEDNHMLGMKIGDRGLGWLKIDGKKDQAEFTLTDRKEI